MDCSICLEECIQPVQLPCNHIFCFLCVKGVSDIFHKCAICRKPIPPNYFDNPVFVSHDGVTLPLFDGCYQWFYEGKDGWWVYDSRTSRDLETAYRSGAPQCTPLIAGRLYYIDFNEMVQYRSDEPHRRRKIKRDAIQTTKIKGVAGVISVLSPNSEIPSQPPQRPSSLPTTSQNLSKETSYSPSAPVLSPNTANTPLVDLNDNVCGHGSRGRLSRRNGEGFYKCKVCKSSFVSSDALIAHMSSHVQTYSCNICGESFRTRRSLHLHERIHDSSPINTSDLLPDGQSNQAPSSDNSSSNNPFNLRHYTQHGESTNRESTVVESDGGYGDDEDEDEDNKSETENDEVDGIARPFGALRISRSHNQSTYS